MNNNANKLIKSSKKWRLSLWDFAQGAILAVLSAITGYLIQSLFNMDFTEIHWNVVGTVAASAFLAYLQKKLPQAAKIVIPAKDVRKVVVQKEPGATPPGEATVETFTPPPPSPPGPNQ